MKIEDAVKELETYLDEGTNHTISFEAIKTVLKNIKGTKDYVIMKDKYTYKYFSCNNCHSEVGVSKSSLNYSYDKGYMVSDVSCPCCGSINRVDR